MNCEKCGRPLKTDEKKFCPHCKNEQDAKIKDGVKIGGGVLAALGIILVAILKKFSGKGGNNT